jgi:putative addiction module component (TIGR02574 family)
LFVVSTFLSEDFMGSPTLEKIRSEALSLPESDRAELAHSLVASLDGPADADAASAWDAEILRRLAEIDSDTANLIDREEFRRRMRARLSRS